MYACVSSFYTLYFWQCANTSFIAGLNKCLNVADCSGSNILKQFKEFLKAKGIFILNIIGIASDGVNVIIGGKINLYINLKSCMSSLILEMPYHIERIRAYTSCSSMEG